MSSSGSNNPITAVKFWLEETVIGFNFCPFAKHVLINNKIHFENSSAQDIESSLYELLDQIHLLEAKPAVETSLLIFSGGFDNFNDYLDLVDYANRLLVKENYEGVFQLASFHPDYCFAGTDADDPSNYTNRSPYPILHLLRESSLEKALEHHDDPESIPERNISFAQQQGSETFKKVLQQSLNS